MTEAGGAGNDRRTIRGYFHAFAPAPEWDDLVLWPPDVFALANLVLDHTEGYRFVVAPPAGRRWPPLSDWNGQVRAAAEAWSDGAGPRGCEPAPLVRRCWSTVMRHRGAPLASVRTGEAWDLAAALLTLFAIADEACAKVASRGRSGPSRSFERRAWKMLQTHGSLSRLSPTRVRIVPKTRFSMQGITIRSLSRYLALCYESVDVRWRSSDPEPSVERDTYNVLLAPWPLAVRADEFRPALPVHLDNMDTEHYGFFELAPAPTLECDLLSSLLDSAVQVGGRVDAVMFPESAIDPDAIADLEHILGEHEAGLLVAGVRQPSTPSMFGRNYLHFGVRTRNGWSRYEQDKHHRWCLDERQIRQYRLSRSLQPTRRWWEAIEIRERILHIIDVGAGVTAAPLVCEDLARLDEVADLVRRIGPSLVVALLLDGPQLGSRWPARYASVIADDPGSAVLTLTSYGMAARCHPPGTRRSRVVAHWNSRTDGVHEIELEPKAAAVLLTAGIESSTLWTADGRRHSDVPQLTLSGVHSLTPPRRARSRRPHAVNAGRNPRTR